MVHAKGAKYRNAVHACAKPSSCCSHPNSSRSKFSAHSVCLCALQPQFIQNQCSRPATPTVGASHRSVFQLVVGASRRRAAPRSQFANAASLALLHFVGYRGPRRTSTTVPPLNNLHRHQVCANANANSIANLNSCATSSLRLKAFLRKSKHCGLTNRSTGPIAACRHLGYKKPSPNASPPQWAG